MDSRIAMSVACGGVCGAAARWGLGEAIPYESGWPWAIFVANVVGALTLGALTGRFGFSSAPLVVATTTGFCGALTTFSSFAVDLALFLRDQEITLAVGYLLVSLSGSLLAYRLGSAATTRLGAGEP
jgi:fluoride exporter